MKKVTNKTTKSQSTPKQPRDWKKIRETIKTWTLAAIFFVGVGFYLGIQYQVAKSAETHQKVTEAVKEVSLKQSKDNQ